jgi:putative transposase
MCEVLDVCRQGYYKWRKNPEGAKQKRHNWLLKHVRRVFAQSRETYGVRRIHAQLKREGILVNRKVVAFIMRKHGISPRRKRRYRVTTDSKHNLRISRHKLKRRFITNKPNQVWVSDITYIDTREGWLYLATFIDLYSRRVVGWCLSDRMTSDIVVSAYDMARSRRGTSPKMVHSDRGVQYASDAFREELKKYKKCKQSMSRKGNCWDNAPAESFFGALKSELIHQRVYETRKEAEMSVFEFIEIFYNNQRLHSALGYLSPNEFEQKGRKAA